MLWSLGLLSSSLLRCAHSAQKVNITNVSHLKQVAVTSLVLTNWPVYVFIYLKVVVVDTFTLYDVSSFCILNKNCWNIGVFARAEVVQKN